MLLLSPLHLLKSRTEPIFEEEMIPITEQEEQKQAPPPPEAPKVEEVLQIAENMV